MWGREGGRELWMGNEAESHTGMSSGIKQFGFCHRGPEEF